ncbi:hypothetical protein [Octadecabacter antarcticus]|uniref:hypothetical protein n=1 Tax=Octadecabacter antarcticus TaxID=1217908 RepID=UPI001181993B|nr:hypothetical protein [Octadecabacter antarcticus]
MTDTDFTVVLRGNDAGGTAMSESYLNKFELKDGQVILFHRQHAKRPVYHVRIHVREMQDVYVNKVTYVRESTGETD